MYFSLEFNTKDTKANIEKILKIKRNLNMNEFDLSEFQKMLADSLKPIQEFSEAVSELYKSMPDFSELFKDLQEQIEEIPPILREAATKLGKNGWVFPMNFTPAETCEITENDYDLDLFFLQFYSIDDNFYLLTENILNSALIGPWQTVFKQCIEAYLNDKYLIAIPALLCITEGLASNLFQNKQNTKPVSVFEKHLKKAQEENLNFIEVAWLSLVYFFEDLYENSNFNGDEPLFINRHWVLHGRSQVNWTKADALRLFAAIETLIFLLDCS